MGANFVSYVMPGDLFREQVKEDFDNKVEQSLRNDGHSYSGCIGMLRKLNFHPVVFATVDDAQEFIETHQEKWEPALAVRAKTGTEEVWVVGGWCSS